MWCMCMHLAIVSDDANGISIYLFSESEALASVVNRYCA